MHNYQEMVALIGLLMLRMVQISVASVVSTGDFNKDFFVMWSPSHVNTSADGRARSLKLDQESGTLRNSSTCRTLQIISSFWLLPFLFRQLFPGSGFSSNEMFLFGQIDMQIKLVPRHSAGTVVAYYVSDLCLVVWYFFWIILNHICLTFFSYLVFNMFFSRSSS